jgi:peptidoglycan/xylan/chitin deacetylase (PgdA/CDA1 family)
MRKKSNPAFDGLKSSLKTAFFVLTDWIGLNDYFLFRNRGKLKVLLYHNVCPSDADPVESEITIDSKDFRRQIAWLKKKCNIVSPSQAGEIKLDPKKVNVLISFDDGLKNNLTCAAPILREFGVSALFLIVTEPSFSGAPFYVEQKMLALTSGNPLYQVMKKDELLSLRSQGHVIGSHSLRHEDFSKYTGNTIDEDLSESKKRLHEELSIDIEFFAFPWGFHREDQISLALQHYQRLLTTQHGFNSPGERVLKRNECVGFWQMKSTTSGVLDFFR